MDKPRHLSMKDYLVRTLAVKLRVPEKTLDAVISHQFQSANEAMLTNKSIEISGFGKLLFNKKKAEKKMVDLLRIKGHLENRLKTPEGDTPLNRTKLESVMQNIAILKPKLTNEPISDLRGVEEQSASPSQDESPHQTNQRAEIEHL